MLKITGGKLRGSKLEVPQHIVRPTSAIKREALFSKIENLSLKYNFEIYKNKCILDLFAGSGSISFEAISRGIEYAQLYEVNSNNIKVIKKNALKLNIDNIEINKVDLLNYNNFKIKFDVSIVFMDPPYSLKPFNKIIQILQSNIKISHDTIIVLETNEVDLKLFESGFKILDKKKYGKSFLIYIIKN